MSELKIHQRLAAIMRELSPVGKDGFNPQQKYNYRKAEDVYNEVHPLMAKHGVFLASKILEHNLSEQFVEGKYGTQHLIRSVVRVAWSFMSEIGDMIETQTIGEGVDYSGDKATNKAMTAAQKMAICQLFVIPTQEANEATTSIDSEHPKHDASKSTSASANIALISEAQQKRFHAIRNKTQLSDKQVGIMLKGYGISVQDSLGKMVKMIKKSDYQAICNELEAEAGGEA